MEERPVYKWKINFHIEDVKLDKTWGKNNLVFFPKVEKRPNWSDKNDIFGYCRIETAGDNQEEAERKGKEIIEGVVASCSVSTGFETLQINYIQPPQVENETELKAMNLPVTRNIGPITLYASRDLTANDLDLSYAFFEKVKVNPNVKELLLAMNWFQRATAYRDPYDRFIAFWISFNAFYNLFYPNPSTDDDATKMEHLAKNLFEENEAQKLVIDMNQVVSKLTSAKGIYLSTSGNTDWADKLEESMKNSDFRDALHYALRCIYGIRKTLFHGDRDTKEKEKKAIQDVNPMLKQIIRRSLLKYVNGKI